ncbi:hypothetical protein A3Q56_07914 [Intoshia linei]|uniref:AAA+ ATPase domain-containing protein n=1 Tax=Intoshia linei TaxID=1819745 RepID=A0A177AQT9_9BILA|nr:hypothetical protein A3Q56_07914 [Intoshia linei]
MDFGFIRKTSLNTTENCKCKYVGFNFSSCCNPSEFDLKIKCKFKSRYMRVLMKTKCRNVIYINNEIAKSWEIISGQIVLLDKLYSYTVKTFNYDMVKNTGIEKDAAYITYGYGDMYVCTNKEVMLLSIIKNSESLKCVGITCDPLALESDICSFLNNKYISIGMRLTLKIDTNYFKININEIEGIQNTNYSHYVTKLTKFNIKNKTTETNYTLKYSPIDIQFKNFVGMGDEKYLMNQIINAKLFTLEKKEIMRNSEYNLIKCCIISSIIGGGKSLFLDEIKKSVVGRVNCIEIAYGDSIQFLTSLSTFKRDTMTIIFIDEIDIIFECTSAITAQICKEIDNVNDATTLIIGTTSSFSNLPLRIKKYGRMGFVINLKMATLNDKIEIIKRCVERDYPNHKLVYFDFKQIARKTNSYSHSDLVELYKLANTHCASKNTKHISISDFEFALNLIRPVLLSSDVTIISPNVAKSEIVGMDDLFDLFSKIIVWPNKHKKLFKKFNLKRTHGVLLYGPPGCCKSMIVRALATEFNINLIYVRGPELREKWVGSSEKNLRDIFRKARSCAPSILFFDEIDSISQNRETFQYRNENTVSQLLCEMDTLANVQDVLFVGATNLPHNIDEALLRSGRLDKKVYVRLPNFITRCNLFRKLLKPTLGKFNFKLLADNTNMYSGAEIISICHESILQAIQENSTDDCQVCMRHLLYNIENLKDAKKVNTMLLKYEEFEQQWPN